MNEQALVEVLTADERLAPDPAEVLAGVAGGIRRRRQRRVAGYAAALVALVLLGGALVTALPRSAEPVAAPQTGDFQRTVRFGWLPDGLRDPVYSASTTGEGVNFGLLNGVYLRVEVSSLDWAPKLDHPGWQQVQVAGRPGRLASRPTRTLIDWTLPSGRWAHLEYGSGPPGGADAQPALRAAAERIAAGVTEGAREPLKLAFGLDRLPAGMRIVGVYGVDADGYGTVEIASGSEQVLSTTESTTEDGITHDLPTIDHTGRIAVSFMRGTWMSGSHALPGTTRIDDIRGRTAFRLSEGSGVAVDWQPHGWYQVQQQVVVVGSTSPLLTLDEYRAVAAGVRWLGR